MKNISHLNYVSRIDISENFESSVVQNLECENHVLLGFAGVGKSTSAKGIAATYILNGKPSIYLKIDRVERSFQNKFEIVEIAAKKVAIPTITIPYMSINQENLLSSIINALSSIHHDSRKLSELSTAVNSIQEKSSLLEKIKEPLKNILINTPQNFDQVFEYCKLVSDAMPYVSIALNICKKINDILNNKKLESEQNELLVIVDDLEDLNPNWLLLQKLLSFKFRFLFVMRVETPQEYLLLLKDRMYPSKFLEKIGIALPIRHKIPVPLPSPKIFEEIMTTNYISKELISEIWTHSGGIPAVALMLWKCSIDGDLSKTQKSIAELCNNQSLILSWKSDDVETRISYTMIAIKVIYEELKRKNYGYVALTVQPNGISQDELALFCSITFGEICNDKNQKVSELVHLYDNFLSKKNRTVTIKDEPCINSPCKFTLDSELVETFEQPWYYRHIVDGKLIQQNLPTISSKKSDVLCYSFNSLFRHITPIITQLEKTDSNLHNELEAVRKTLFEIITEELKQTSGPTNRLSFSAHKYLETIDNFGGIEDAVTLWTVTILSNNLVLIYLYENFDQLLEKIIDSASKKEINLAKLLPQLCYLMRQPNGEFHWLAKKITESIKSLKNSSNRLVLLMLSQTLGVLAESTEVNMRILSSVGLDSDYFLKKICEQNDPLSSYSKVLVYTESAGSYFSTGNYSEALQVYQECDLDIRELKDLTFNKKIKLEWFREFNVLQDLAITATSAQLNSVMGTLYFYLDDLDQSVKRYDMAIKEWRTLEKMDGVMIIQNGPLIAQFMKNGDDEHIKKYLKAISNTDNELLNETQLEFISILQPKRISTIHVISSAARLALHDLYDPTVEPLLDHSLTFDHDDFAFYYLLKAVMHKFLVGTDYNMDEMFSYILFSITLKHNEHFMASLPLMLHMMKKKNRQSWKMQDVEISFDVAKNELLKLLDNHHDLTTDQLCRSYREKDPDSIIESMSFLSLTLPYGIGVLTHLSIHLLYGNYDLAEVYIDTFLESNPMSSKLLKRISRQMRLSIHEYYRNKSSEKTLAKEIILNYLRLWYFLHD